MSLFCIHINWLNNQHLASFESLKQLATILSRDKLKNLQIIGEGSDHSSMFEQFYDALQHDQLQNDAQAAALLYDRPATHPPYYMLKTRLFDRMLDTLFLIDTNQANMSTYQKAYHDCYRNAAAVRLLIGRGARQVAVPLAEKTLKKASKFEFIDIVLNLAKDLRMHYGNIIGDHKKYQYYHQLVQQYRDIYLAELLAEEYYTEMAIHFARSRATKIEVLEMAEDYAEKLKKLQPKYASYRFNLLAYSVQVFCCEIANDYQRMLPVCQDALAFFQSRKALGSIATIFNFQIKQVVAYLQLKAYDQAEAAVKACLEITPEGSSNWYMALYYQVLIYFRSQKYQEALPVYLEAVEHPSFKRQYTHIVENWRIYEAFVHYFISVGKISSDTVRQPKKFRLSRFLNEVPTYSKDKRGTNISILILQILFLLDQQKYNGIIDRVEALKTYSHRYLRKDDTFRSNCFIKMLLQLPQADFHPVGIKRKAQPYLDKLQSVPLEMASQSAEVEIVPYERLWKFVLESLNKKS